MTKKNDMRKTETEYGYYSKLLKEPFDTIEELQEAEEAYYAKQKAKEDAANVRKAEASKVEDAFRALNAAKKSYKADLAEITQLYADALKGVELEFSNRKAELNRQLSEAEQIYKDALKSFTEKYPEGYRLHLKDGDYESVISTEAKTDASEITNLFDLLFRF